MAEMRYSREVDDDEYDIINNQPVAEECLAGGCQCDHRETEIARLIKALQYIATYRFGYDGSTAGRLGQYANNQISPKGDSNG